MSLLNFHAQYATNSSLIDLLYQDYKLAFWSSPLVFPLSAAAAFGQRSKKMSLILSAIVSIVACVPPMTMLFALNVKATFLLVAIVISTQIAAMMTIIVPLALLNSTIIRHMRLRKQKARTPRPSGRAASSGNDRGGGDGRAGS